ncbi:MAG: UDP-N-acetylmuramoyl-L-alanyl-D-glutamate--2,6-diaminopimelate ligase [Clostridia bacterium]|nr:UDP-N-acetylmuramoyl-L-alanyl-D-glutamate--2,6-diaminopimelate ligase [Clostridia bacterium]
MRLKDLLKDVDVKSFPQLLAETEVRDIQIDHKRVQKGDVFIALKGRAHDGNDYAARALEKGAAAIVSENDLPIENLIRVSDARSAYALMSKHFFKDACDSLRIIAITGTNGKTTTANTISSLLQTAGARVGTIGTLGAKFNGKNVDTGLTTPDPYMLHKIFAEMKKEGQEFAVMETSAHALALNKLDGIKFEIGVLTNITEDHLDYFGDMQTYAKAKYKLFENGRVKLGVVCGGKNYCDQLALLSQVPLVTYGINGDYDIVASAVKKAFSSSEFECSFFKESFPIKTPLVGGYNIENALAAITVCRCLGIDKKIIQLGMSCLTPVEGRFNVIQMNGLNIIIDFAHTPDGLEKVLKTAKELTEGKLVVIFGCGGNRDKKKRPIMGGIAQSLADEVILTSDNPRFEEPLDIIDDIKKGMSEECAVIPNRKKAIEYALKTFNNGETIVVAGKGGERYQEIKGRKYAYNDFDVVYDFYRKNIKLVTKFNQKRGNLGENVENYGDFDENEIK